MTMEQIILLARDAGFAYSWSAAAGEALERFAALVAAAEREACAMWADSVARDIDETNSTNIEIKYAASYIAKGIRARGGKMTPQQAYEKRYAHIDHGQHTWDAAPPHVKEMWLAAWTIAWAMGEEAGREAVAGDYVDKVISVYQQGRDHGCEMEPITDEKLNEIIKEHITISDTHLLAAVYMICRDVEAAHGILEEEE